MKDIRDKINNYLKVWIAKKNGDDDDLVDTYIDQDKNYEEPDEIDRIEESKEIILE